MMSNCKHPCCGEVCRRPKKARKIIYELQRKVPIKKTRIKKKRDDDLEEFFEACAIVIAMDPFCIECGAPIDSNLYRAATAHIFPKKTFKSIRAHLLNWLQLGSVCGCHNKTHRLDTFSKMKCFTTAVENFRQFESDITERNKYLETFKELSNELNNRQE